MGELGLLSIFQDQLKIFAWSKKVNGAYWLSSAGGWYPVDGLLTL